jgi:hypothetical protein
LNLTKTTSKSLLVKDHTNCNNLSSTDREILQNNSTNLNDNKKTTNSNVKPKSNLINYDMLSNYLKSSADVSVTKDEISNILSENEEINKKFYINLQEYLELSEIYSQIQLYNTSKNSELIKEYEKSMSCIVTTLDKMNSIKKRILNFSNLNFLLNNKQDMDNLNTTLIAEFTILITHISNMNDIIPRLINLLKVKIKNNKTYRKRKLAPKPVKHPINFFCINPSLTWSEAKSIIDCLIFEEEENLNPLDSNMIQTLLDIFKDEELRIINYSSIFDILFSNFPFSHIREVKSTKEFVLNIILQIMPIMQIKIQNNILLIDITKFNEELVNTFTYFMSYSDSTVSDEFDSNYFSDNYDEDSHLGIVNSLSGKIFNLNDDANTVEVLSNKKTSILMDVDCEEYQKELLKEEYSEETQKLHIDEIHLTKDAGQILNEINLFSTNREFVENNIDLIENYIQEDLFNDFNNTNFENSNQTCTKLQKDNLYIESEDFYQSILIAQVKKYDLEDYMDDIVNLSFEYKPDNEIVNIEPQVEEVFMDSAIKSSNSNNTHISQFTLARFPSSNREIMIDNIDENNKDKLQCDQVTREESTLSGLKNTMTNLNLRGRKRTIETNPKILEYIQMFIDANFDLFSEERRQNTVGFVNGFHIKKLKEFIETKYLNEFNTNFTIGITTLRRLFLPSNKSFSYKKRYHSYFKIKTYKGIIQINY